MRSAEKYFTNSRADRQHSPSVKSCLIRIPGTFNSKNSEEVRIVQRWNGEWPPIQLITTDLMVYLIQKRIDKIQEKEKEQKLRAKFANPHLIKIIRILSLGSKGCSKLPLKTIERLACGEFFVPI